MIKRQYFRHCYQPRYLVWRVWIMMIGAQTRPLPILRMGIAQCSGIFANHISGNWTLALQITIECFSIYSHPCGLHVASPIGALTLRGVGFLTYGMVWGGLKVPADKTRPLRSTEATTDATNHDKYFSWHPYLSVEPLNSLLSYIVLQQEVNEVPFFHCKKSLANFGMWKS